MPDTSPLNEEKIAFLEKIHKKIELEDQEIIEASSATIILGAGDIYSKYRIGFYSSGCLFVF